MKLLLVDIGYDCEELNEPLGIEVLCTYVKNNISNIDVDIYYSNIDGLDYAKVLKGFAPDSVGVSTHINTLQRFDTFYTQYQDYCKINNKSVIVLVGGILGTYEFEYVLKYYRNTVCMIGEGEESLLYLLNESNLLENLTYEDLIVSLHSHSCVNIAYIKDDRVFCKKRKCMESLQNITYPSEHKYLAAIIENKGLVRIESSRGCPWNKCSFCVLNWKYAGYAWRAYSLDKVISEIINVSLHGASVIYFTDEEFIAGDFERLNSFINRVRQLKTENMINSKLEFVASTSVQALLGKYGMTKQQVVQCLRGLKEIGFRSFFLGIESGCDGQLLRFKKGCTIKESEEAIKLLRNLSIESDIGYILFDPLLTVEELHESLKFIKRNGLSHHISRFAKRLRLVPYTEYSTFEGIESNFYDYNWVETIYKFQDCRIQKIYDCYSCWENEHLTQTHTFQAEIRASESLEKNREVNMNKLIKIREDEFYVLSKLVEMALKNQNFCFESNNVILENILLL